jgi:catechol 2,3-dioxygenase-like lactoylglutathione lyase family enzyme
LASVAMDMKLELVAVPVTDADRAKQFYVEKIGFVEDNDQTVSDQIRFVQLTPPGSACSIAIGKGPTEMTPARWTTCRWWSQTPKPPTQRQRPNRLEEAARSRAGLPFCASSRTC